MIEETRRSELKKTTLYRWGSGNDNDDDIGHNGVNFSMPKMDAMMKQL